MLRAKALLVTIIISVILLSCKGELQTLIPLYQTPLRNKSQRAIKSKIGWLALIREIASNCYIVQTGIFGGGSEHVLIGSACALLLEINDRHAGTMFSNFSLFKILVLTVGFAEWCKRFWLLVPSSVATNLFLGPKIIINNPFAFLLFEKLIRKYTSALLSVKMQCTYHLIQGRKAYQRFKYCFECVP